MCGLVGAIGNLTQISNKMFRDLLIFDQVRGFDSTGMVFVPYRYKNQKADMAEALIHKKIGTPDVLFYHQDTTEHFDAKGYYRRSGAVLIGHNRAATVGKINDENAHPFNFDHVYGAHNGSLITWSDLEGYKDFDVDSMGIFKTIADKGIKHTWSKLHGAAALTWWDDKEEVLHIIRNNERPLWYATNKQQTVMYWASEYQMLVAAAARNKVDFHVDKEGISFRQFKVNHLYTFKPTASGFEQKGEPVALEPRPFVRKTGTPNGGKYSGPKQVVSSNPRFDRNWLENTIKANKNIRKLRFHRPTLISKYTHGKGCIEVIKFFPFNMSDEGLFDIPYFKNKAVAIEMYPQSKEELKVILNEIEKYPDARYRFSGKVRESLHGPVRNLITLRTNMKGIERYYTGEQANRNVIEIDDYKQNPGFKKDEDKEKVFLGPHGVKQTLEQFEESLSNCGQCCSYCGTVFTAEDHEDIHWHDRWTAICHSCHKDDLYRHQMV